MLSTCASRTRSARPLHQLLRWALSFGMCSVLAGALFAGTFGTVVPIGGQASDLALDEARGVVYVANYTSNEA